MSEQWQGLHNPNQHKRYKDECRCVGCGDYEWCASEYPCRCCLAAEVEVLRASVQRVRELLRLEEEAGWPRLGAYQVHTVRRALDGGETDE